MKNLALGNFGVQELGAKEMKKINGGIIPAIIAAGVAVCGGAWFLGEKMGRTLYNQLH